MSIEKTAEFLADCLSNMPPQKGEVKVVVDTAIDGLKMIAQGREWPAKEASEAAGAAANAAVYGARAAVRAAWAVTWAADWASATATSGAIDRAANWAALAHPDPAKERARQAKVREELGL